MKLLIAWFVLAGMVLAPPADMPEAAGAEGGPNMSSCNPERRPDGAALSHELRNPLNAIVCAASLIEPSEVPPEIRPQIEVIRRQARRLARLLDKGEPALQVPSSPPSRVVAKDSPDVWSGREAHPRRIVIVEDDNDGRVMLSELMRRAGYEVESANDGVHGLRLIAERVPSVAVLDIDLPGLTGYEIARRVRADVTVPTIRLIALTARATSADRQRALDAGFDEHLAKPVTLTALQRAIQGAPVTPDGFSASGASTRARRPSLPSR
jgi:CheY-like chemotaxis protein